MADPVRIAIIDDDPAVLNSLRMYFEWQALQTSCFNAPEAFLAAVDRSAQFDCASSQCGGWRDLARAKAYLRACARSCRMRDSSRATRPSSRIFGYLRV